MIHLEAFPTNVCVLLCNTLMFNYRLFLYDNLYCGEIQDTY